MNLSLFKKAINNPEYIVPYIIEKSGIRKLRYSSLKNRYQRYRWKRIPQAQEISVKVKNYHLQLNPSDYSISRRLYFGEPYEPATTDFLLRTLDEGDTFVDVGANIGYFSLLASSEVGDSGRVIAFEPDVQNFEILEKNVAGNGLNERISLHQKALSDSSGVLTMNHHPTNKGMHSIVNEYDNSDSTVEIEAVKGDSILPDQVDLIKIDVEGAEPYVIDGLSATINRCHPMIIFEYEQRLWDVNISNTLTFLSEIGYEFSCIVDKNGGVVSVKKLGNEISRANVVAKFEN